MEKEITELNEHLQQLKEELSHVKTQVLLICTCTYALLIHVDTYIEIYSSECMAKKTAHMITTKNLVYVM